jgi:hypothetical protein
MTTATVQDTMRMYPAFRKFPRAICSVPESGVQMTQQHGINLPAKPTETAQRFSAPLLTNLCIGVLSLSHPPLSVKPLSRSLLLERVFSVSQEVCFLKDTEFTWMVSSHRLCSLLLTMQTDSRYHIHNCLH